MKRYFIFFLFTVITGCNNNQQNKKQKVDNMKIGLLEKLDPALDGIISPNARAEIIAEGFDWSEGPVWIESHQMLLFSDVPRDTVYKWTEEGGKEVYLTPSGYTGTTKRGGEMGYNGLLIDKEGHLVLCQHGNRQVARMEALMEKPEAKYVSIAGTYQGKKFNSPNDAVYNSRGELFFTDPPYGLEKQADDPKKELLFNGVYKVKKNGEVVLLIDSITRPNGIAFFPGEKRLLVACSDPEKPNWYVYDVGANDSMQNGKIFYSCAGYDTSLKGLPDGMKIDRNGNVFATGPGGLWIFNRDGKVLGKIKLPEATSNCAFSPDEKTLYITNDMYLLRMKMRE